MRAESLRANSSNDTVYADADDTDDDDEIDEGERGDESPCKPPSCGKGRSQYTGNRV